MRARLIAPFFFYFALTIVVGPAATATPQALSLPLEGLGLLRCDLRPIDPAGPALRWTVDGEPAGDLTRDAELSLWAGTFEGHPHSHAWLITSRYGSAGWAQLGGLGYQRDDTGVWRRLPSLGSSSGPDLRARATCAGGLPAGPGRVHSLGAAPGTASPGSSPCPGRLLRLAWTVDPRLVQLAGGPGPAAAHAAALASACAHVFERDAGVRLAEVLIDLQTQLGGPWDLQGQDCAAGLALLASAWPQPLPGDAHFGMLLAGADLACSSVAGAVGSPAPLAVCGSLAGPNGGAAGAAWDLFNIAHTLGHGLGALHAGDYCPPLELCAPPQFFGPCQQVQDCSTGGTLMGACHLCPGGVQNIEARFHPVVAQGLAAHAAAHLPVDVALVPALPERVEPGVPLLVALTTGPQLTAPAVRFRYGPDLPWLVRPMAAAAPGSWSATLPPGQCGETFELRFDLQDSACGPALWPDGGTAPLAVEITRLEPLEAEDFESPSGWMDHDLGATSGNWVWAAPLPAGQAPPLAPTAANSGFACFVTANNSNDVDGGTVALVSREYDLPEGPFQLSYAYYLGLAVPSPADGLRVEVQGPGSQGAWIQVATHQQGAQHSTDWREHTVTPAELTAAGLVGGPGIRVRFLATDGDGPSLVEAAVDDVELAGQACFF